MLLPHDAHLAYCTNIHPGRDWPETLRSLEESALAVRERVCPKDPYAIGLRLSATAARQLSEPKELTAFRHWLETCNCYVFTINGFPFGDFHGQRVKENVYRPDWTTSERLEYTNLLFDILAQLLPPGVAGSVSTLPGSFKRFIRTKEQSAAIRENLYRCFRHIQALGERNGIDLHLGMEPEPLGLFETTKETVAFFDRLVIDRPEAEEMLQRIGVNYDTCHLAVEYEDAASALGRLQHSGIRISKIHLSSALKVSSPGPEALSLLESFCEDTYLHQVIARTEGETELVRYEDLPAALAARRSGRDAADEWRIHFHIPLHASPAAPLQSTADHLLDTLAFVREQPSLCGHFEMETYTWGVLPPDLRNASVVDQLVKEYEWTLPRLR